MKITFVLSAYARIPVGGYKVVYEYANGLQDRGHTVSIVHPRFYKLPGQLGQQLKGRLWPYKMRLFEGRLVPWFSVHPAVRLLLTPDLSPAFIPDGDVVVATAWQTAEQVKEYPVSKGRKKYLVYAYEEWKTEAEEIRQRMANTYRADTFDLIATSSSVQEMLEENGAKASAFIPCGLDFTVFKLELPIEKREPGTIGFPVRRHVTKGAADALEALKILREKYGTHLKVKAYGPQPEPSLPDWIEYLEMPTDQQLKDFYNNISIFLFPSHYEGWGLPGTEALACGAALVTSDSGGIRDYARANETAIVVPIKRPDLLAEGVDRLLRQDELRQQLAREGHEYVKRYTWKAAVNAMEQELSR